MKHHTTQGPSQRQLRVGEQLRHIIAETFHRGHFHDEALMDAGKITVTEVRCSPDLKNATAFVMSLGGENIDHIIPALNEHAHIFQKEIGKGGTMKFTPRVRFMKDESFENAQNIENLLRDLNIPKD